MALINPTPEEPNPDQELQDILQSAGLIPATGENPEVGSLKNLLKKFRLAPENVLREMRELLDTAETDNTKLQILRSAAEMNKMLKPEGENAFSFSIVIKDQAAVEVNPILIPRTVS